MRIRHLVDRIGNNVPHITEWVRVRRPDVVEYVDTVMGHEDVMLLMATAYAAGRASVIAEVEGTTVTEVESDPDWQVEPKGT